MKNIFTLTFLSLLFLSTANAQTPPSNDDCAGAIEIMPDSTCTLEAFSSESATEFIEAGFWCAGNPDDDVWFRFTATKPRMSIQATGLNSYDATVQLYTGTCSNLNPEPCADAAGPGEMEEFLAENLTVGQDYFFRVFDRGSVANQDDFIFELCVVELDALPFVANDFPCDALVDTALLESDGSVNYYSNVGATISDNEFLITPDNGICEDYDYTGWCSDDGIQNSIWFAFEAPASGAVFIDVCNEGQTEIQIQSALYAFDDCNNFSTYTFIAGNEEAPDCTMGSQLSSCDLTPGETYLILVDGYQIATGLISISLIDVPEPSAGTDTNEDVCKNTADFDLFAALPGADPNGFWIDADATGNLINGTFNAQATPAGTYDFIYVVEGFNCFENDSATVSVTTLALPDAGENGSLLACTNAGELNLFTALEGTPETGGYWIEPSGDSFNGLFDPAVDAPGNYTYIIASTNMDCPSDSAFAIVTTYVTTGVDPGENGDVSVCSNSEPFEMFDFLEGTPDENGQWFNISNDPVDAVFDPATQDEGNYFYIVTAAGCGSDFSILSITVDQGPVAGIDADSSLCFNGDPVDLFGILGGNPDSGGNWEDPLGNANDGSFDPTSDPEGNYWYFVSGTGCPDDSAMVTINSDASANAGLNSTAWSCYDAQEFFLITLLGGSPQPGGVWSDPNGDPFDGFFNPANDITGAYTYSINGACDSASAVLTVNIELDPNAGMGNAQVDTVDVLDGSVDLFGYLSDDPETSGSWLDLNNSGGLSGDTFTPDASMDGNDYVFAYVVSNVCGSDTAYVDLHVVNSTSINEYQLESYAIYPNPVQDQLTIEAELNDGSFELIIYDLSGRISYKENIVFAGGKSIINLDLQNGAYLLSLRDKNAILINQSLIIQ